MGNIDRIVYMPILTLELPRKRVKYNARGELPIKPLRSGRDINSPYSTGCDKWPDCLTCPEKFAMNCELAKNDDR